MCDVWKEKNPLFIFNDTDYEPFTPDDHQKKTPKNIIFCKMLRTKYSVALHKISTKAVSFKYY